MNQVVLPIEPLHTGDVIRLELDTKRSGVLSALAALLLVTLVTISVIPIDKVVTGRGEVITKAGPMYVSTPNRAVIRRVLVRPGDAVRRGALLAELDSTASDAEIRELDAKIDRASANIARLTALQTGASFPLHPATSWETERARFKWQMKDFQDRIRSYDEEYRITSQQLRLTVEGAEHLQEEVKSLKEFESMQSSLAPSGLSSRATVLNAVARRVEAQNDLSDMLLKQQDSEHQLVRIRHDKETYINSWNEALANELIETRVEQTTLTQERIRAKRVSELSAIVAPQDALVLDVNRTSIGAVPGTSTDVSPLFTLLPTGDAPEVELDLSATDVGFVKQGDEVILKLDTFNYAIYGTVSGTVLTVTPQPKQGRFRVGVKIGASHLTNAPGGGRLVPGMTLSGDIVVGGHTILQYLAAGIVQTGSEAMREP